MSLQPGRGAIEGHKGTRLAGSSLAASALAVVVTSACASAGAPSDGSTCVSDRAPHDQSIEEVVDSAALAAGLGTFWEGGAGLTLAIVTYDSLGVPRVNVMSATHSDEEREGIAEAVKAHSIVEGEPERSFQLVLGDSRGPAPYRARQLRSCAPEMLNREFIAERLQEESRRLGTPINVQSLVAVEVQRDGGIADVRLMRGSGNTRADQVALRVARETTWRPAMWEGIPISGVWGQFPVTFRSRRSSELRRSSVGSGVAGTSPLRRRHSVPVEAGG